MPLLHIQTNIEIGSDQVNLLLSQFSRSTAQWLGKSEGSVQVILHTNQPMLFAGSDQPNAHIRLESLGFGTCSLNELCQKFTELMEECLTIPPERIFIRFCEVERDQWGWKGKTFGIR